MVSVTARKIRELGTERPVRRKRTSLHRLPHLVPVHRPRHGDLPRPARPPHDHTPVKRVLGEPGGKMIYVETENSVYRLEIHGEPLFPMRAAGE